MCHLDLLAVDLDLWLLNTDTRRRIPDTSDRGVGEGWCPRIRGPHLLGALDLLHTLDLLNALAELLRDLAHLLLLLLGLLLLLSHLLLLRLLSLLLWLLLLSNLPNLSRNRDAARATRRGGNGSGGLRLVLLRLRGKLGLVHDLFLAPLLLFAQHGRHALPEDLGALVGRQLPFSRGKQLRELGEDRLNAHGRRGRHGDSRTWERVDVEGRSVEGGRSGTCRGWGWKRNAKREEWTKSESVLVAVGLKQETRQTDTATLGLDVCCGGEGRGEGSGVALMDSGGGPLLCSAS